MEDVIEPSSTNFNVPLSHTQGTNENPNFLVERRIKKDSTKRDLSVLVPKRDQRVRKQQCVSTDRQTRSMTKCLQPSATENPLDAAASLAQARPTGRNRQHRHANPLSPFVTNLLAVRKQNIKLAFELANAGRISRATATELAKTTRGPSFVAHAKKVQKMQEDGILTEGRLPWDLVGEEELAAEDAARDISSLMEMSLGESPATVATPSTPQKMSPRPVSQPETPPVSWLSDAAIIKVRRANIRLALELVDKSLIPRATVQALCTPKKTYIKNARRLQALRNDGVAMQGRMPWDLMDESDFLLDDVLKNIDGLVLDSSTNVGEAPKEKVVKPKKKHVNGSEKKLHILRAEISRQYDGSGMTKNEIRKAVHLQLEAINAFSGTKKKNLAIRERLQAKRTEKDGVVAMSPKPDSGSFEHQHTTAQEMEDYEPPETVNYIAIDAPQV